MLGKLEGCGCRERSEEIWKKNELREGKKKKTQDENSMMRVRVAE